MAAPRQNRLSAARRPCPARCRRSLPPLQGRGREAPPGGPRSRTNVGRKNQWNSEVQSVRRALGFSGRKSRGSICKLRAIVFAPCGRENRLLTARRPCSAWCRRSLPPLQGRGALGRRAHAAKRPLPALSFCKAFSLAPVKAREKASKNFPQTSPAARRKPEMPPEAVGPPQRRRPHEGGIIFAP